MISVYYHPQEFLYRDFQDVVNFGGGINTPPEEWQQAERRTPLEIRSGYEYYGNFLRFMQSHEQICFISAGRALQLYADHALRRNFSRDEVLELARGVQSAITFQAVGEVCLSASEIFFLLAKWMVTHSNHLRCGPLTGLRTPSGPTRPAQAEPAEMTVSRAEFERALRDVWSGALGVISPFERQRNKGLSVDDVPQALSVALTYELPVGSGKCFLSKGGVPDKILGGWQISSVYRASSGIPFFFRSGQCNVPGQFRVGCIPAIKPGANPFAQDKGNFEPSKPLFNRDAFEAANSFNFYYGNGPRVTDVRGFGFYNHDFGLIKNTRIAETVTVQIRAEFFNLWSWHTFNNVGTNNAGARAFNVDVSSPNFGRWTGAVSSPRNIQVGAKVFF